MRLLFVGENQSPTARLRGWVLGDMRLSSKTLLEALDACGFPRDQTDFINLYDQNNKIDQYSVEYIKNRRKSYVIVGMGRPTQRGLAISGIGHIEMIHPAARGKIRRKELYQEHVAQVIEAAKSIHDLVADYPELSTHNVKV